jgi:hypothetical protein
VYYRDPKCVHVDDNLARANLVAAWLGSQGIPADVMNELTLGGFEGLVSILPSKLSFRGVEVWVKDPADADRARQLLAEHAAELQAAKANRTGTVEAVCEECGEATIFPAAEQGTIQTCPHCGALLDVPDPDADWGDEDFGEDEAGEHPAGE